MFFAVTSTALERSHVAYADPINSENHTGEDIVDAPNIQINIDSGLLSLDAIDASLAEVLTQIGKQASIEIFLQGDLDVSVTSSFSNEPLADAIERLLGDTSFVMVYGQSQSANDPPPLLEVRVNGGSAGQAAPAGFSADELNEDQSEEAVIALRTVMLGLEPTPQEGGLFTDLAGLDKDERLRAMQWLADLGDEEAARALGRFLALDKERAVRNEAAFALGQLGSEAASEALALGLGDNDPDVRFQVVEALGGVARHHNTFVLGQVLFGETDPEIRISAIAGLDRLHSDAAWAFLETATEDLDPKVRKFANDIFITWDL